MDTATTQVDSTSSGLDSNTESILAEVYQNETAQSSPATQPTQPQANNVDPEVEFTWKGKAQKMPWSKAKSYVQKGFDYEQSISNLKKEREEFVRERSSFGDFNRLKELKALDEYSRANPAFLDAVKKAYQQFQSGGTVDSGSDNPTTSTIDPQVSHTLNALQQTVQELVNKNQQVELSHAGKKLDSDLTELKKNHDYLDWDNADEFGYNREHRVLKYIQDYGVDAEKAFWALFGKEAAQTQAERAAKKVQEDFQEKHKRGRFIATQLSKSPTFTSQKNIQAKSYDDISRQIMKDFNLEY